MKKIVIAGAGFGGLNTALLLEKKFKNNPDISITLIDGRNYHLFNPSLYEVAASEEEFSSLLELKHSITLPIAEILRDKKIKFIQGKVGEINPHNKTLEINHHHLDYDYLVLALGSKSEYFNIQGAREHSFTLKSLNDAFAIRNALEFAVESHRFDVQKKCVRVVVAGGGYTGVELAAELASLRNILAWKYSYPIEKIEVVVLEAAAELVPGFSQEASRDIYYRLKDLGVSVKISSPIFKVDKNLIHLLDGQSISFDVLVWTAGVRATDLRLSAECECNNRGQMKTDEYLRLSGHHNIFALGDIACIHAKSGPVPSTGQAAVAQAEYLAKIFPSILENKKPAAFDLKGNPFIISVGGKWAVFKSKNFYLKGFLPYLIRLAADVRYFSKLMGVFAAINLVLFDAKLYSRND